MEQFKSIIVGTHTAPNNQQNLINQEAIKKERWFNSKDGFFFLPRSVREDRRLSNAEFRVLVALASFVFSKDEATPSLETLKKYCGMSASTISKATSKLEQYGWVRKTQRPYTSVYYELILPNEYKKDYKKEPTQLNLIE